MTEQRLLSLVRQAVERYGMIGEGDRIAVGVSGGKDSLTLLYALARLSSFYPKSFSVRGICVDLGLGGADFNGIKRFAGELGVELRIVSTQIGKIVLEERKEKNPCSMCAKMRRGALHNALKERGISKIALGHHFDDAVETFFLSLFYEGRLSCFQPVTYLDRMGITQIRPLLYCGEGMVRGAAKRHNLPIVHNPCPADGYTRRQEVKELVAELSKTYPNLKNYVFGAMQRLPLPEWGPREYRRRPLAKKINERPPWC